ncbi:MAG: Crp/Fnr family transcriptional regulator [Clostridia bacterium]|nr:Crp/Fnr family transcriptional regulator [Clostridia bacterium]
MDKALLSKAYIFSGLSENELDDALSYLSAREKKYKKGQTLITLGNEISEFAVITKGTVQISCDDINGNQMIMATVTKGNMFAESLAVTANIDSPIYATATEDTVVVWLKASPIRKNIADSPLHTKIIANFIKAVALKCLSMNDRVQILSKKTIREKVIAYLSLMSEHGKRDKVIIPLSRQDMASYLGVERSALSRELSRMQTEGIISFKGNQFRFLQ